MNRAERRRLTKQRMVDKVEPIIHNDISDKINNMKLEATQDGILMGMALVFMTLKNEYGFSSTKNGKGKLDKLVDAVNIEIDKMDQDPTKFCYDYQIRMLKEKTGIELRKV